MTWQTAIVSIPLYGCLTWTLTKRLEKKLDGNYTRMLRAMLNKSWWQHPTKQQLYGHQPPITKTKQFRRTRSKDELVRDVFLWSPSHGRIKAGWPARTYIQGVALRPCQKRWTIWRGWREKVRESVLMAQQDDDDEWLLLIRTKRIRE